MPGSGQRAGVEEPGRKTARAQTVGKRAEPGGVSGHSRIRFDLQPRIPGARRPFDDVDPLGAQRRVQGIEIEGQGGEGGLEGRGGLGLEPGPAAFRDQRHGPDRVGQLLVVGLRQVGGMAGGAMRGRATRLRGGHIENAAGEGDRQNIHMDMVAGRVAMAPGDPRDRIDGDAEGPEHSADHVPPGLIREMHAFGCRQGNVEDRFGMSAVPGEPLDDQAP